MGYEIQRMMPRHFKVLELTLDGYDRETIALRCGISPQMVTLVQNSPVFQGEISRRRDARLKGDDEIRSVHKQSALKILDEASEQAALTQVGLMESQDDNVRFRAAESILRRSLGSEEGPKGPTIVINAGSLRDFQLALQESRKSTGAKSLETIDGSAASIQPE